MFLFWLESAYWDAHFLMKLMGGLTFATFEKPPAVVLTIGEGTDFWVLAAAKEWKVWSFKPLVIAHKCLLQNTKFYCVDMSGSTRKHKQALKMLDLYGRIVFDSSHEYVPIFTSWTGLGQRVIFFLPSLSLAPLESVDHVCPNYDFGFALFARGVLNRRRRYVTSHRVSRTFEPEKTLI
jgi:hypothetical protein